MDDVAGSFRTVWIFWSICIFRIAWILRISQIVLQVIKFRLLLLVDHLLIAQSGQRLRIPVDHTQATIDVAFAIEVDEHLDDTLRSRRVHRERRAVPVARSTQTAQLLQYDATMLVGPVPGMLEELLTGQVVLLDALFSQTLHHLGLGGYRRMVGTGHPAGILALHPCTTHKDILNCIVEHVTHVEHTSHIGRRNDNRVGLAAIGLRTEQLIVNPILVPFTFDLFRVVFASYFHTYLIYTFSFGVQRYKEFSRMGKTSENLMC